LFYKEVLRFWKVSAQTIAAPVLTALLYMLIFGHLLEGRITVYDSVGYTAFLVPGLVMMSLLQNAFANSSSSMVQSKMMGNLVFILLTPLGPLSWFAAYVLAAVVRGLAVGLGVLLVFAVLILTGAFVSNVVGRWWVRQWDKLINLIPIVKSIYTSVKKVSNTLFSSNGNAFRKTVLIEYPHSGSWTIAFQTGAPSGEVASLLGEGMICVYVPTTPNPTSGFFLMVHQNDVKALSLSVDQALTYVLSMGAVAPDEVVNAKEIEKISPLGK
jgi:uncharacterized membrane protein